jgi:hypothetical protein
LLRGLEDGDDGVIEVEMIVDNDQCMETAPLVMLSGTALLAVTPLSLGWRSPGRVARIRFSLRRFR